MQGMTSWSRWLRWLTAVAVVAWGVYVLEHVVRNWLPRDVYAPPHPPYVSAGAATMGSDIRELERLFLEFWEYGP